MLSQEHQRRLQEIEDQLNLSDPAFVSRMNGETAARPGPLALALCALMWAAVPIIGIAGGLLPALIAGAAFVVCTVLLLRRSARRGRAARRHR